MNTTDTYEVRHDGVLFLTGKWTWLNEDSSGGMFEGTDAAGRPVHTGLAVDYKGLRTFTVVTAGDDEGCVYGNSGSQIAACDKDAVTTRGGFGYCAAHAGWYDWAEAHQNDDEEAGAVSR